ncbi:hypothetical protein CMT52_08815 [Elizabethkingia anophelis]|nr:hypothetical protein [Elizabethkingia anophelis]
MGQNNNLIKYKIMKKIISFFTLVTSIFLFSQEKEFSITKEKGLTDYIVTDVTGKTASEIYNKTLEWINRTYKNPDKVILSKIENNYIRIEGASNNIYVLNALGSENPTDSKYQLEISFKDGKYKLDIIELKYLAPQVGWTNIPFDFFYKKDGELKSMFKFTNKIPTYFNSLNKNLYNYISGTGSKNDNW